MRILHVSAGNLYGGVETLLATLARSQGSCPEMLPHFALCFDGRLAAVFRQTGVPVHMLGPVRVSRPWTVGKARRNLAKLLQEIAFDVVICHSVWPMAIFGPVVRANRRPLVFWLHATAPGTHWLERWARRTAPDLAVCNSRFTAATLKNLYPAAKCEVIYCPVAMPEVACHDRAQVRVDLSTPENTVLVIQVSRLEQWKGHLLHLEALGKLRNLTGWMAWFVGGAQRPPEVHYLEELKSRTDQLKISQRVRFLGQRSDVPRLLAAADIHCQPNTGPEPFGITFVEGMLAGLPVVTTAMGGAHEIVTSSCGILVPCANPEALADSLRELIQDPEMRTRLGGAGPARARSLCDPDQQMARLCAVCHRAVNLRMAA